MELELTGKKAIVTPGAAQGIGRATALLLTAEGATVAALDHRQIGPDRARRTGGGPNPGRICPLRVVDFTNGEATTKRRRGGPHQPARRP